MSTQTRAGRGLLVAAALLAWPLQGLAEEVVVKNDLFVSGGAAVIVGDFVPGEHAGVRLTSPCNGAIVAVQVAWLEGTPGHPPSLEQGIYIFEGSTFPTPGAELAFLEGPVLTPGFINEFRYLDEAGTIPINVPVTAGQQFYVTLQFDNPTDVGDGGPSVIRDVNGCQSGKNVLKAQPGGWLNFCIYISGDLVIRAVVDCAGVTGACCHADGTCVNEVEAEDCTDFGDEWYEDQTCAEITCVGRGACCSGTGCFQLLTEAVCDDIGGTYAGDGTDCDAQACVPGACCDPATGTCTLLLAIACADAGGQFQGPGTDCDPNPCPQPVGACCVGTFCLPDRELDECVGGGGVFVGPGTDCDPNPCEPPADCAGDCNCDGVVDLKDINYFAALLLQPNQQCHPPNFDVNGDGVSDLRDINPFVMLLSSGPYPIPCE